MYKKQYIGRVGEEIAAKYLLKNGYKIKERNFYCNQGEIDIIAFDNKSNEIVFFEIKTRTSFNYGFPAEAVNRIKQKHILNSAKYYLYSKKMEEKYVRIDVLEVVIDEKNSKYKINHLKGVLQ